MDEKLIKKIESLIDETRARYVYSNQLYNGKFISLIEEVYVLPDNRILKRERIVKNNNKDAVIIVAVTEDNNFLLVVQNRINKMTSIEFPSGYIEDGETVFEATYRELIEETGYEALNIIKLDAYQAQLGIDSSVVNIVIAKNCIKKYKQNLSSSEYINFMEFTFEEVWELIDNNIINGVGNKLAFYKYIMNKENYKPKTFKKSNLLH